MDSYDLLVSVGSIKPDVAQSCDVAAGCGRLDEFTNTVRRYASQDCGQKLSLPILRHLARRESNRIGGGAVHDEGAIADEGSTAA